MSKGKRRGSKASKRMDGTMIGFAGNRGGGEDGGVKEKRHTYTSLADVMATSTLSNGQATGGPESAP